MERERITIDNLSPEIIEWIKSKYMDNIIKQLCWPKESRVYVTKLSEDTALAQIAMLEIISKENDSDDRKKLIDQLYAIKSVIQNNLNGIAEIALDSVGIKTIKGLPRNIEYWNDGKPAFGILLPEHFSEQKPNEFIVHENSTRILSELEKMCGQLEQT